VERRLAFIAALSAALPVVASTLDSERSTLALAGSFLLVAALFAALPYKKRFGLKWI
jgi:NADH:ubiquinone oxidoreductase subunit 6 (subunit J)